MRDIKPGEIVKINKDGLNTIYQHHKSIIGLCSFEILYFLNENSFTDGLYIKNIRKNLGRILAFQEDILTEGGKYIVIGIPETGILYGVSYAKEMDFKYRQLITKNEHITRTFIGINNQERKNLCEKKFVYDQSKIYGKKIVIVDDSIVRGNVIKSIISKLRKYNALEIHVRIPAPPVIDICELGISIQSKSELIMNNKTVMEVCREINANSLSYLQQKDLFLFPKKSYNQCFSGFIEPEIKEWNNKNFISR
jgi:amidophosphoribosyltransferase